MYLLFNYFLYAIGVVALLLFVGMIISIHKDIKEDNKLTKKLLKRAERGDIQAMEELSNRANKGISNIEALSWGQQARELSEQRRIKREKKEKASQIKYESARKKYEDTVLSKL